MIEQVPRLDDLQTAAIEALLGDTTGERRIALERFAHSGRFGDIIRGWRGQAALVRNRFVREVLAHRRRFATGQALVQLADSEYFARLPTIPQLAIGHAVLTRTLTDDESSPTGTFSPEVVKAGTKINLLPDRNANPVIQAAEYEVTEAVAVGADDTTTFDVQDGTFIHRQEVTVPIRATRPGPHANTPIYDGGTYAGRSSELPESTPAFVVASLVAAGGTDGPVDAQLNALAGAMALGRSGPTVDAVIAGALSSLSVRHVAYMTDYSAALGRLFIGDESWASSPELEAATNQALFDGDWIGFGCKVACLPIVNTRVVVEATVILRSREFSDAKPQITESVLGKLRPYFDDRPDFWTWDIDAIGGIIASADTRILTCTEVEVQDADRSPLTAPAARIPDGATSITHYALVGDPLALTFALPS